MGANLGSEFLLEGLLADRTDACALGPKSHLAVRPLAHTVRIHWLGAAGRCNDLDIRILGKRALLLACFLELCVC